MLNAMNMQTNDRRSVFEREKKPPECAGIYTIYDEHNFERLSGKALNLRKTYEEQKKNGAISESDRFDYSVEKRGFIYDELLFQDRIKVEKYNPPLIPRDYNNNISVFGELFPAFGKFEEEYNEKRKARIAKVSNNPKRHFYYVVLGYERIDVNKEIYYLKEPKALFFMFTELVVKILLAITAILAILGLYLRVAIGGLFNQYVLLSMIATPLICFSLFGYIRRNKLFSAIALLSTSSSIVLYFMSYPLLQNWPFI